MRALLLLALLLEAACAAPQAQRIQRLPLQKDGTALQSPTQYEKRVLQYDPKTGEPIHYDQKSRIVPVDARSGKYAFKWIGYDGKEKIVEYQRADAIDAIVSASLSKTSEGQYLYVYSIKNLPSTGEHLSSFTAQNFAADVKPIEPNHVFVGHMTNLIRVFRSGNWVHYSILHDFEPVIVPGRDIEFRLVSSAPPGLVECRITGGNLDYKGMGEDLPPELENAMAGYEEWPRGYTIGPVDNLKSLSSIERAKRLLDLLPKFRELGWMTDDSLRWYQRNLKRSDFGEIYKRADQDLKTEQIAPEVFAMIHSIKE